MHTKSYVNFELQIRYDHVYIPHSIIILVKKKIPKFQHNILYKYMKFKFICYVLFSPPHLFQNNIVLFTYSLKYMFMHYYVLLLFPKVNHI